MAQCFYSAARFPPITKQSLSELDIGSILSNPKLRHDVNFDRELHFRPNLDGAKGRSKIKTAEEYWDALVAELELYNRFAQNTALEGYNEQAWAPYIKASQVRIPLMFETIRDILKNLLPEREHASIDKHLDVSMLMQEIEKGVCDLLSISRWLAQVLKAHCAPMRDAWVDKMVKQTEIGVETCSMRSIVCGLRELLGILEAMKLDVANHQIRHLRAMLIEATIKYEQESHRSRIECSRMSVESSREWYLQEKSLNRGALPAPPSKNESQEQLAAFVCGVLRKLVADPREPFPETFYLDFDRLRSIRTELQDLIHFEICSEVFNSLAERLRCRTVGVDTRQLLRDALFAITGFHGSREASQRWTMAIGNIAVELVRQALQLACSSRVYDSGLVQKVEEELRYALNPLCYARHAAALESSLIQHVLNGAVAHISSSPIEIFNAFVAPTGSQTLPSPPPPPPSYHGNAAIVPPVQRSLPRVDAMTDLTRRITHIAILHWRIWSPLVYLNKDVKIDWSLRLTPCTTPQPAQVFHAPTPPPSKTIRSTGDISTASTSVEQRVKSLSSSPEPETGQPTEQRDPSETASLAYRNLPR